LYGGHGNDILVGGPGNNTLKGDKGQDSIFLAPPGWVQDFIADHDPEDIEENPNEFLLFAMPTEMQGDGPGSGHGSNGHGKGKGKGKHK
jgi:Ca2+-binding RTX toxin-like protein